MFFPISILCKKNYRIRLKQSLLLNCFINLQVLIIGVLSVSSVLPGNIQQQMLEYAMKLDQVRKNFEKGKIDSVDSVKKLGGVKKNSKAEELSQLEPVKQASKLGKIDTKNLSPGEARKKVLSQVKEAESSLSKLIKSLKENDYGLSTLLLELDLQNIQKTVLNNEINISNLSDFVNKLDSTRKTIEDELRQYATESSEEK